jgi:Glycosyl hydrolases family 16
VRSTRRSLFPWLTGFSPAPTIDRIGPVPERSHLDERFEGPDLDGDVWISSYLPAWSSRAASKATYAIDERGLRLSIPAEQPLWCPDLHDGPLRVSAVQTGNWSGPVGSSQGQQPFRDDLVVREQQPAHWGFTPHFGHVEVECRATIGPRSMFSAWMVGLEDRRERCGEICLVEVFGDTLGGDGSAAFGTGIHRFRDPALTEEFSADRLAIDVTRLHRYAVDWRPGSVDFLIDGRPVRTVGQAPDYPMQLIVGLFDFPDRGSPGEPESEAELIGRSVKGRPLPPAERSGDQA